MLMIYEDFARFFRALPNEIFANEIFANEIFVWPNKKSNYDSIHAPNCLTCFLVILLADKNANIYKIANHSVTSSK